MSPTLRARLSKLNDYQQAKILFHLIGAYAAEAGPEERGFLTRLREAVEWQERVKRGEGRC